tara:strand:- start:22 stop:267 length:246 start_codon:yes stop_codon:yes gene_type:complete
LPKLRNIVTGTVKDLPARYIGLYPYEVVEETPVVSGYVEDARDGDGDGLVQDGTPFEREEGTELTKDEKVKAVEKSKKSSK